MGQDSAAARRLAAIMFTDIVDYTALMGRDEAAGRWVRQRHEAVVRPLVIQYQGEWVEERGDESLSIFPSALDAVNCALAIQAALRDDAELQLRIGVHSGDVTFERGRVIGDGVNVASRIRALAEPGGICVSDEVQHSVQNQPNIETQSLGPHDLKNVPRPVSVFAVAGTAAAPRPAISRPPGVHQHALRWAVAVAFAIALTAWALTQWSPVRPASDASSIRSLAVLPLDNLSGDPEQEYFSDGMTEALIGDLARIASLRVISRTSVMQYKNNPKSLPEIAEELGVDAVVEGSVLRDGDRVRITVQLIDARSDHNLWADRFDRDLHNVLAMQSEIAQAVARRIAIELSPNEKALLENTRPVDPVAHEAYLRGRYEAARFTTDGFMKAIEQYRKALAADPEYASAYAGLADAYYMLGQPMGALPHHEAMPKAKAAALEALQIDPSQAEALAVLAFVTAIYDWDWEAADATFRRAIDANPNLAYARGAYGIFLSSMARHEEAIAQGSRAVELDPLSLLMRIIRSQIYYLARDYERAVEECQKMIEMGPTFATAAHTTLSWVYVALEDYDRAIEADVAAGDLMVDEAASLWASYRELGKDGYWRWYLEGYEAERAAGYISPARLSWSYARLGNADAAFDALEQAYEMRDGNLVLLNVEPFWDPIREDPRFAALLRRMNFPQDQAAHAGS